MRICLKCGIEKSIEEFYKHPLALEGRMTSCKECKKSYQRQKQDKYYDRWRYNNNPRRRLNVIFRGIRGRCYDTKNPRYYRYGARGIKVLRDTFEEFFDDMFSTYIEHREEHKNDGGMRHTTIERINNDGNYCKDNCKWATYKEQSMNRSDNKKK